MDCNYAPYIQITGTTSFPRLRSSPFTKRRELESLFQQERSDDDFYRDPNTRNFLGNDAREIEAGGSPEGSRGNSRQAIMTPNEAASRAFHERYSYLTPAAFCFSGPDGSKSLCLNRKEYNAIVERSRNRESNCVFLLRSVSRCSGDQDLDDEGSCTARAPPTADCRRRRTFCRPTSPVYRPKGSCRGSKPRRANACAMNGVHLRTKEDKKRCSTCLRGSCGRPLNCSPQPYIKTSRPSKPCDGRLRSTECHRSKYNTGSCCSDVCHRVTSGCAAATRRINRCTDGCRPNACDNSRTRPTGCCSENSRGSQTNCNNLLPPVWCSDSRRTRLRPVNIEACNGRKPICGYNVYEVRPIDCAKTNNSGLYNGCANEKKFHLSAM